MPDYHAPDNEGHMLQVNAYVERDPVPGYAHAPDPARQAFQDMKYGVRIHWGLYSLWRLRNESWPFLRMSLKRRQAYQQLYRQFNPQHFNADEWMAFFRRVGFKCYAITSKHHEGFSLFDTKTRVKSRVNWTAPGGPQIEACDLAYSVAETPFKRDIIAELTQAARRYGLKTDLYFSHPDWYDADFRPYSFHPLQTPRTLEYPDDYGTEGYFQSLHGHLARVDKIPLFPEPTLEETARMLQRHRQQLLELLTRYGKIDMLCLDMWLGKPVWPELRETVKLLRQAQPDVMLRIRGIGNYGDYYTPEGVVPQEMAETDMPWMVIYPLGRTFSYEPVERYHRNAEWVIRNLVQCTAAGGNFMVGIGPDADGWFHPRAIYVLEEAGAWLRLNGEAVYETRPVGGVGAHLPWHQGNDLFFTRSKDGSRVYAFCVGDTWKEVRRGRPLRLDSSPPREGLKVSLLGVDVELPWHQEGESLVIDLPAGAKALARRLSPIAGVFKISYP
jgi:alpha-L-fucosidase